MRLLCKNVLAYRKMMFATKEFGSAFSIFTRQLIIINGCLNRVSKGVLSVILPKPLEMRFLWNLLWHFMWIKHVFCAYEFWGHCGEGIVFLFKCFSSFLCSCINAENYSLFLVSMSE